MGFGGSKARQKKAVPKVDETKLRAELKMMGYGPEFMARVHEIFFFESLQLADIEQIVVNVVSSLHERVQEQGFTLQTDPAFPAAVAETYTPRDGVRRIINQLQVGITRSLSQADIKGLLDGVKNVQICYGSDEAVKENDTLTIYFHLET